MTFAVKSNRLAVLALLAGLQSLSTPGLAQGTPDQRSACMADAFQFCSADIPNVPQIEACLRQNRQRLTPGCQAEFTTNNATRIRPEHFQK